MSSSNFILQLIQHAEKRQKNLSKIPPYWDQPLSPHISREISKSETLPKSRKIPLRKKQRQCEEGSLALPHSPVAKRKEGQPRFGIRRERRLIRSPWLWKRRGTWAAAGSLSRRGSRLVGKVRELKTAGLINQINSIMSSIGKWR